MRGEVLFEFVQALAQEPHFINELLLGLAFVFHLKFPEMPQAKPSSLPGVRLESSLFPST